MKMAGTDWSQYMPMMEKRKAFLLAQPHEDVYIKAKDGLKLHGVYFPGDEKSNKLVICFHGYTSHSLSDFIGVSDYYIRKGRNVIGRSVQADIRLMEDTVSETHAVIVVRHIHTPVDRYVFTITDKESTCGTFINGENADFNTYVIEDHTRIRFGNSYECIFLRLDTQFLNLKAAPGFAAVKEDDASLIQEKNQMGNLYAPNNETTLIAAKISKKPITATTKIEPIIIYLSQNNHKNYPLQRSLRYERRCVAPPEHKIGIFVLEQTGNWHWEA